MDVFPLSERTVNWSLKPSGGSIQLDRDGFGQITMTSLTSPKTERLRINVGNEVLFMKAGEITRVVTPRTWCN
jgi:hypothetical protein